MDRQLGLRPDLGSRSGIRMRDGSDVPPYFSSILQLYVAFLGSFSCIFTLVSHIWGGNTATNLTLPF